MLINKTINSLLSIENTDIICQHYLTILYHEIKKPSTKKNSLSETQGEILYEGVNKLLSTAVLTEQDVLVDLGSASGRVVAQVFLKSAAKEVVGIEFLPELHQQALNVAQKIQQDGPHFFEKERKLTFLLGNFLEVPLAAATVILINSICLNQQTLYAVGEIINGLPNIRTVLTSRPMAALKRLPLKKTVRIECSWDTTLFYVYGECR